ncbi:MAG TPA: hypothetical protein VGK33_11290, partial [Chloroflexota bacterium]
MKRTASPHAQPPLRRTHVLQPSDVALFGLSQLAHGRAYSLGDLVVEPTKIADSRARPFDVPFHPPSSRSRSSSRTTSPRLS